TSRAAIGGPRAMSSQSLRILPVPRQMRSRSQATTRAKDGSAERLQFAARYLDSENEYRYFAQFVGPPGPYDHYLICRPVEKFRLHPRAAFYDISSELIDSKKPYVKHIDFLTYPYNRLATRDETLRTFTLGGPIVTVYRVGKELGSKEASQEEWRLD